MEIREYQYKASRTAPSLGTKEQDCIHMILGIITEAGEVADAFKKNIAYGKEIDWINVKEEIGDIMWYISNLAEINKWDLREILETNIKKLEVRYPEKFTQEAALNRDLHKERQILESK